MPMQVIVFFVLVAAALLLIRALTAGNPAHTALMLRRTVGSALILLSILLLTRGLLSVAVPIFLLGLVTLLGGQMFGLNIPWGQKSPGQKSSVRTSMLDMDLDHDSGDLDGEILSGRFAGRRLNELSLAELLQLRSDCAGLRDQTIALLDAYLDRMHTDWREQAGAGAGGAADTGTAEMTLDDAYDVLGLAPGCSAADIRTAHRKLMKKFHPDHGGSEYLAQQINQARDMLLTAVAS